MEKTCIVPHNVDILDEAENAFCTFEVHSYNFVLSKEHEKYTSFFAGISTIVYVYYYRCIYISNNVHYFKHKLNLGFYFL